MINVKFKKGKLILLIKNKSKKESPLIIAPKQAKLEQLISQDEQSPL